MKIQFWIPNYFEQKWEETADDLGGGVYRIKDFMHSGYGLVLTIKDGKLSVSLPAGSSLYIEDDWGGYEYRYPAIYWYVLSIAIGKLLRYVILMAGVTAIF